ncbi:MAG: hypothetical protein ACMG6H_04620 [Acidobacteriota bacterium]
MKVCATERRLAWRHNNRPLWPTSSKAEIVSFTTLENTRSRAVMERIGMRNANEDFEHPAVHTGHALRLHCLYRLGREDWHRSDI